MTAQLSPADPAPAIEFTFTVDRFGFRPGAQRDTAFARAVIEALDNFEATITFLFGDFSRAVTLAIEAGMLPEHPTWQRIAGLRAKLRRDLPQDAINTTITEAQTRAALEELRLFLRDLDAWSGTFHAGARAAAVAGASSLEKSAESCRLRGLQTLVAVFEFDLPIDRNVARQEFERLRSAGKDLVPPALRDVWSSHLPSLSLAFGSFAEAPARMRSWLDEVKREIGELSKYLGALWSEPGLWQPVESAFWQLWRREVPGVMTRSSDAREITVLDLVHATRHGSIPVVPPRGGHLSIGQWSRIFGLARGSERALPSDIIRHAAECLGIGELKEEDPIIRDLEARIRVIRPVSSRSPAWKWAPEKGIRAICLMPGDIVQADDAAIPESHSVVKETAPTERSINGVISNAVRSLRTKVFFMSGSVDITEFIELDDRVTRATASQIQKLKETASRAFFAFDPYVSDGASIRNPSDVGDLIDQYLHNPVMSVLWSSLKERVQRFAQLFAGLLPDRHQ